MALPARAAWLTAALLLVPGLAAARDTDPWVRWLDAEGRSLWTRPLERPPGEGTPLLAPRWFDTVPEVTVPLLDGGTWPLSRSRGRVLLIDFWASWCAPCLVELPHLQALHDAETARGLDALAINAQEPPAVARATAERLSLRLPIGVYDEAVDEVFGVRALPATVLIDRQGRLRERWNAYGAGLEDQIAARTRELLLEAGGGPTVAVGTVHVGAGRLAARWMREVGGPVGGVASIRSPEGRPRVVAHVPGTLWAFEADGTLVGKPPAPQLAGRLRAADLTGDGVEELIGYRVGLPDVALFDVRAGTNRSVGLGGPVLGLTVVPASSGRPATVLAATASGIVALAGDGTPEPMRGPAPSQDMSTGIALGPARAPVVLVPGRGLATLEAGTWSPVGPEMPGDAWSLLAGPTGLGVASRAVKAWTPGRFLDRQSGEIAVAVEGEGTRAPLLVLLEGAAGEVVYAASIPDLGDVLAADLDGDGRDELVLAVGRSVVVLGAPAAAQR